MKNQDKRKGAFRNGAILALALAGAVGVALVADTSGDAAADPEAAQGKDPAAQAMPADHPQPGGMVQESTPGADQLPPGHPPIGGAEAPSGMPAGHPPTGAQADQVAVEPGAIPPLEGEGAVTVSELIGKAARYEGQNVRIAAKVTRSTMNVLGKNWLHVSDGTGSADTGDHDLVVTTQDEVQAGEIVVIEGKVVRDKDLGSGYRYDVLVEDAKVSPQQAG